MTSIFLAIIVAAIVISFWLATICSRLERIISLLISLGNMIHAKQVTATARRHTQPEEGAP